jgi:predicted dehydrogenase
MTTTTRWGIAGAGRMAQLFAEGLGDAPGAELVAVASRSREHAEAFAASFGVRRAHETYDGLADDRDVDIVYVATPNSDHRDRVMMMLAAGKPVVCEKPFSLNAVEASEMIALSRSKRVFCMEAMWMRFLPAVREFAELVRGGALGHARAATIELGHSLAIDPGHPLLDPALGGGALLDLGPYVVSFAHMLFGPPSSVQSQAVFAPSGADRHLTALLGHSEGRQSMIGASLVTRLSNGATVAGTDGWGHLHEPLYRPDAITICRTPRLTLGSPDGVGIREHARRNAWVRRAYHHLRSAIPPAMRGGGRRLRRPYRGNGYCHEAIEAMRCLRTGELESPAMRLDETLQVMQTLDSIRAVWRKL